jgi:hypothetical protein
MFATLNHGKQRCIRFEEGKFRKEFSECLGWIYQGWRTFILRDTHEALANTLESLLPTVLSCLVQGYVDTKEWRPNLCLTNCRGQGNAVQYNLYPVDTPDYLSDFKLFVDAIPEVLERCQKAKWKLLRSKCDLPYPYTISPRHYPEIRSRSFCKKRIWEIRYDLFPEEALVRRVLLGEDVIGYKSSRDAFCIIQRVLCRPRKTDNTTTRSWRDYGPEIVLLQELTYQEYSK